METIRNNLPLLLVFILLAVEGLGIRNGHDISLFLLIALSPILLVDLIFYKKILIFPKHSSVFFILFIASSFISAFPGLDFHNSFLYSLYLVSLFIIFVCFYNYRLHIRKALEVIIFLISGLLSIYSLLLNSHFLNLFIPYTGYQLVYEKLGHNHLGDFLVLPSVFIMHRLYYKQKVRSSLPFLIFFLILILISHSRSAYLTLLTSIFFIHLFYFRQKKPSRNKVLSRVLIIVLALLTFFLVTGVSNQGSKLRIFPNNTPLYSQEYSNQKNLLGYRPEYYQQSFNSIKNNTIVGIGADNFEKISFKYASNKNLEVTKSAHNIFLEVMVGQGILGIIPFAGFLFFIFLNSKTNALYLICLAMLINFQFDYTYQIYSFFTLFIAICAVIVNDRELKFSFINGKK